MAFSVVWDSTFRGTPAGGADIREGDDRIRELKDALQERLEREHYLDSASNANQGLHLEGSAVSYYAGGSDPTNRPDGVTALGDNVYDKGRLYVESTAIASANSLKTWDGTAWEYAGLAQTTQDVYGDKTFKGNSFTFASGSVFTLESGLTITGGPITLATSVDISGDLNVGGTFALGDNSVTQAKLKTSTGSVSTTEEMTTTIEIGEVLTLPGGEYGFYPRIKNAGGDVISVGISGSLPATISEGGSDSWNFAAYCMYSSSSYAAVITIGTERNIYASYATQRYVTASGELYWIFQVCKKSDGRIISQYQAPDHPSFGFGTPYDILDTPFLSYNTKLNLHKPQFDVDGNYIEGTGEEVDIVVINPLKEQIAEIKNQAKRDRKDPLEIISEVYEMADIKTPLWPDKDGKPGYYPEPVTVGLANDEFPFGGTAEIVKRAIPKPRYVQVKKLVPRNLTQV